MSPTLSLLDCSLPTRAQGLVFLSMEIRSEKTPVSPEVTIILREESAYRNIDT